MFFILIFSLLYLLLNHLKFTQFGRDICKSFVGGGNFSTLGGGGGGGELREREGNGMHSTPELGGFGGVLPQEFTTHETTSGGFCTHTLHMEYKVNCLEMGDMWHLTTPIQMLTTRLRGLNAVKPSVCSYQSEG